MSINSISNNETLKKIPNIFLKFNVAGQIVKVYSKTINEKNKFTLVKSINNSLKLLLPQPHYNMSNLAQLYSLYIVALKTTIQQSKLVLPKPDPKVRAEFRIKEISDLLATVSTDTSAQFDTYIDLGCGDGFITELIGRYMGFKNVYGMDLFPISNEAIKRVIISSPLSTDHLRTFADASVNFITALVSLHHISTRALDENVRELGRITARGGYLLLREHDLDGSNHTDETVQYLDLIHMINLLTDLEENALIKYVLDINYCAETHWDKLLGGVGFNAVKKLGYEGNNPQHLYYKLYRREGFGF